jgi:hypothetical protein
MNCSLLATPAEGWGRTVFGRNIARPACCWQALVGARVAFPQSPILRWSMNRTSHCGPAPGLAVIVATVQLAAAEQD